MSRIRILALACLGLAMIELGAAGWIQLKAALAQQLIARAWSTPARRQPGPLKPWPWADTWPIARLEFPDRGVDLYVLAGGRGNALAFGPGHLSPSAAPGDSGVTVISGHRDTHFAFLAKVAPGERLQVSDRAGNTRRYRVRMTQIVDTRRGPLRAVGEGVILVTCFPFDTLHTGGPLRYLVIARPE